MHAAENKKSKLMAWICITSRIGGKAFFINMYSGPVDQMQSCIIRNDVMYIYARATITLACTHARDYRSRSY